MAAKKTSGLRIVGVKPTTVGMLQGTTFFLVGLMVAITHTVSSTVQWAESTESVLRGLALGLAGGFIAIVCVPLIYFAIGWVLGSLQGVIINALVSISGGIVVETQKEEE
jgi:vacuolar-type H+-ATPase subunit I/STV1